MMSQNEAFIAREQHLNADVRINHTFNGFEVAAIGVGLTTRNVFECGRDAATSALSTNNVVGALLPYFVPTQSGPK